MEPRPLRAAYAVEFLIALIAFFECWSQIGGQAPLDLMPWWVKFSFAGLFAFTVVRLTVVAVHNPATPPLALIRWSLALVLVILAVVLTTYYYYLNEPSDEDNSDDPVTTSLIVGRQAC